MGAKTLHTDLYEADIFAEMVKSLDNALINIKNGFTELNKVAKSSIDELSKTFSGKAAKDLKAYIELLNKNNIKLGEVKKKTEQLTLAEKETIRIKNQLEKVKARGTEENKKLIKQQKDLTRQLNQEIKLQGVAKDSLARKEIVLGKLKERYQNLSSEMQTKALPAIQKLDKEVKKLNADIGNHQKNVGNYQDALRGLHTKFLAVSAGVVAGVAAFKKYSEKIIETDKLQTKIRQQFKLTGKELDKVTVQLLTLSDTYDEDYNEILKAANTVSKEFNITLNESFKLINEGFEKGANNSGEFLDILREYPAQLKTIGLNADQSFALITQQVKEGIYSDKGIDALKEAGLRLRELTPATEKAINAIGLSSKEIETSLKAGTKTIFETIQMISRQMAKLPPQSKVVGTAIADIFGGPGEDAGLRYLTMLGNVETDLSKVDVQISKLQQASKKLSEAWNTIVVKASSGESFGGKFLLVLHESITGFLTDLDNLGNGTLTFWEYLTTTVDQGNELVRKRQEALNVSLEDQIKAQRDIITNTLKLQSFAKTDEQKIDNQNTINKAIKEEARLKTLLIKQREAEREALEKAEKARKLAEETRKADESKRLKDERDALISRKNDIVDFLETVEKDSKESATNLGFFDPKTGQILYFEEMKAALDSRNALINDKNREVVDYTKESYEKIMDFIIKYKDERVAIEREISEASIMLENFTANNIKIAENNKIKAVEDRLERGLISEEKAEKEKERIQKQAFEREKKLATIAAFIEGALAIMRITSGKITGNLLIDAPIKWGLIQAQILLTTSQVALIQSQNYAEGIIDFRGKGDEKSDSNPVNISDHESVITAKGTKKAPKTLDAINKGKLADKDLINSGMDIKNYIEFSHVKELVSPVNFVNDFSVLSEKLDNQTSEIQKTNLLLKKWKFISNDGNKVMDIDGNVIKYI